MSKQLIPSRTAYASDGIAEKDADALGVGTTFAVTGTAKNNITALADGGLYAFRGTVDFHLRGPTSDGVAATTTDFLVKASDVVYIRARTSRGLYVSVISAGTDGTVYVAGADESTSTVTPGGGWS